MRRSVRYELAVCRELVLEELPAVLRELASSAWCAARAGLRVGWNALQEGAEKGARGWQ